LKQTELKRTSSLRRTAFVSTPKPAKGPKLKKCQSKECRKPYEPDPKQPFKVWCSDDCGAAIGLQRMAKQRAKQARAERAADQAKLEAMKPAKWWKAKAKKAMHLYVRTRDAGKPCASCDTILLQLGRVGGDYDAGHLRSVGSAKHLEFDERNVWGQCKRCNDFLKGNYQEYERRLRILKGNAFVDELMADQAPRHYKTADFQAIEAHYKAKLAALKKERA
jgi:hypothetical protein